jgi:uncharacterized membrane protein YgdD (TMEM256/DUF423 family)
MAFWLAIGALNGLIAVGAGAYGHHALAALDPYFRDAFATGVDYQMWHALALLAVAWLADRKRSRLAVGIAGGLFTLGILLFSGSLYYLGLTQVTLILGAAPLGGMLLIAGWAALLWAALGELFGER